MNFDKHQSVEPKGIPKKVQVPPGIIPFFGILLFSKSWHFSLFIITQFRFECHFVFMTTLLKKTPTQKKLCNNKKH